MTETAGIARFEDLNSAEREVLGALFVRGPLDDGDVPSKSGRNGLVARGLAFACEGWNALTEAGLRLALKADVSDWRDRRWHRKQRGISLREAPT